MEGLIVMEKFSLWWKNYHGYMIVPFFGMGLIVLFRHEELPSFINISFILFAGYIIFYIVSFIKNELLKDK
jgi:FtsH-binding integral membrane protein